MAKGLGAMAGIGPLRAINHCALGGYRILHPPLCFLPPLHVGRTLACSNFVEGAPLRFHSHVGVTREHGARDVPGDAHDHLVTGIELDRVAFIVNV